MEVTDRAGAGLAKTSIGELHTADIDAQQMRGKGCDGCNTISGRFAGV